MSDERRREELIERCFRVEQYKYSALETETTEEEVDEEEEGEGEEEEQEEDEGEDEEEEVDLFKKDRKKHLGDTSIYDPVGLLEKNVLLPGKPDFVAAYRGQTYRFANEDNRASFLQTPLKYLPIDRPPAVRKFSRLRLLLNLFVRSFEVTGDSRDLLGTRRRRKDFTRTRFGEEMRFVPH